MIPTTRNRISLVSAIFIVVFLWACNGNQPVIQKPFQEGRPGVETQTSTPLPASATPTPSLTPTLTPTPTSTSTPTPTATPTLTPLPTLPLQDAKNLVQELFETNRGCLLPCWWGITPGQTTWGEARQFLEQFADVDPYGTVNQNKPDFYIGVLVPISDAMFRTLFPDEKEVLPYYLSQYYEVTDGVVISIEIRTGYATTYTLST